MIVLLLIVGGYWIGRTTAGGSDDETAAPASETRTVEVSTQEVGRSLTLVTSVTREFSTVATNRLSGTITEVGDLDAIEPGDILYRVDHVPVRAVAGTVPFYRDLGRGDSGDDVAQLQETLRALDLLSGPSDGEFGPATRDAVRDWQESLGLEETGEITLGRLIAIPQLPGPVRLDPSIIAPGLLVSGGESVVAVPGDEPEFVMHLSTAQADLIPSGATLTVTHGEQSWPAVIASSGPGDQGTDLTLTAPDGSSVCGQECSALSGAETINLMTQVEIVPSVTGPAIPLAAISTGPDGRTTVEHADGTDVEVEIQGIEAGIAVVDGLDAGDEIRLPDGAAPPPSDGGG
ncbi:peptidoglycan-binding domain-containing protein [Brachybacterium aquaticum]|uniref:peptidoglycan-binding domain-containing protein n=1 Tax=Brachybacterium aquaticum TaxID=1432564 RepID=UPI001C876A07|nr:peptidoglycan-binding domain-containing protein [Brachybacterium aquaticum]